MSDGRPYSVKTLAERWGCSESHVRSMIAAGELKAFSIGGKLLRIAALEVERKEAGECQSSDLDGTAESSLPSGTMKQAKDTAIRSARLIGQSGRLVLPNMPGSLISRLRECR